MFFTNFYIRSMNYELTAIFKQGNCFFNITFISRIQPNTQIASNAILKLILEIIFYLHKFKKIFDSTDIQNNTLTYTRNNIQTYVGNNTQTSIRNNIRHN